MGSICNHGRCPYVDKMIDIRQHRVPRKGQPVLAFVRETLNKTSAADP